MGSNKKKMQLYFFIMFLTGGIGGLCLGILITEFNTDTKLIFHVFGIIGLFSTSLGSFIQWRYLKKMSLSKYNK